MIKTFKHIGTFLVLLLLVNCGGTKPVEAKGNYQELFSKDIHINCIYNPSYYIAGTGGLLDLLSTKETELLRWQNGYTASVPRTYMLGDSTRIGFKYSNKYTTKHGRIDQVPYFLSDIYFTDIILPGTKNTPTSIQDILEPEVLESNFQWLSREDFLPFIYDENTGVILATAGNNFLSLLDMKSGSLDLVIPPLHNKSDVEYLKRKTDDPYTFFSNNNRDMQGMYLFLDMLGTQKLIYIEPISDAYSITLYDYINDISLDNIVLPMSKKYNSTVNFNNHFVLKYYDYGGTAQLNYHALVNHMSLTNDLTLLASDSKVWIYLSDDQQIAFWTLDEGGFENPYTITRDESNLELFENFPNYVVSSWDVAKFESTDHKVIKMANDLLFSTDSYGSALVFNLKKNGIRERKIGSLKIKNGTLLPEEQEYLAQFDF